MIDTQEEIIVLKALYGKQQGGCTLIPVKDKDTGELRGVRPDSGIHEETSRKISDGSSFNMKKQSDKDAWDWVKENKEIANSQEDGLNEPHALFYIDRPDEIVKNRVKANKLKLEAGKFIEEADLERKRGICRLLGQNSTGLGENDVDDFLFNKANAVGQAAKVIEAFNDPFAKTKLFFHKLMDTNTIKKESSGIYKYGDIILGISPESVMIWLKDKKNVDITGKLMREANKKDPSKSNDSMVDDLEDEIREENKLKSQKDE